MSSRVLSIQSHVVYGYVGNKSATFPLQLLGFDVDGINSVQLSNHTGYKTYKGQILNENDLNDLMEGLSANGLDNSYTHLLTGYVGNGSFLRNLANVAKRLKEKNPRLIFVCDPVLGDGGQFYVPKECVSIYQNAVIPLADILTPNQTELEFLTGQKADTIENIIKGIEILHKSGCKIVVITSVEVDDSNEKLTVIASNRETGVKTAVDIPKLHAKFTGTGDLFTALFLAWMTELDNISIALEITVSTVHTILRKTINDLQVSGSNCEMKNLELKLIQCKKDIENPKTLFHSRNLETS